MWLKYAYFHFRFKLYSKLTIIKFAFKQIYLSLDGLEKAKYLLKKAYKLRKKCLISSTIKKKLKNGKYDQLNIK